MWQLLAKIVLIMAGVLLVPTGLVLASYNAVPGDKTYTLKRTLENGITTLASVHPVTRAYFKTDLSKRRFSEALTLINRGEDASSTLNELVEQTKSATDSIIAMSDRNLRKQFASGLSKQIDDYNKTLAKLEQQKKLTQTKSQVTPTPVSSQGITPTPSPSQSSDYQRTIDELRRLQEELERLKRQLAELAAKQNPTPTPANLASIPTPTVSVGIAGDASPSAVPTETPVPTEVEPTSTPTGKTNKKSAMEILLERAQQATSSPTPTPGATIMGVSTNVFKFISNLFFK